ncbi:hypothetical protein BT63DRAFT_411166 [Microthyrium microscopicum]|uniref:NAD(P)-binding domain-containing protein n=1 Tax=Microthyrium microscopicum TaxID=703497 RepID=A0A6A6UJ69_9PEZI|nr:hypothetical protein BT63DRAFT_411166 [Microthyrium microscopicum]
MPWLLICIAGLAAGHQIRGLARNPSKLPESISSQLESFTQNSSFYDIAALDAGCHGVDAVICAYSAASELALDGQLYLLRAAERAGVKRFHVASWNLNWSKQPLGLLKTYDSYISFMTQARLSSSIKPLYAFIGILGQTFFAVPGAGALEGDKALWQRLGGEKRRINVIGTGEEKIDVATEADAAAFSIGLGIEVEWNETPLKLDYVTGLVDQMRSDAISNDQVRERYRAYIGLVYVKYMLNGEMKMNLSKLDNCLFSEIAAKRQTLELYVTNSPDV